MPQRALLVGLPRSGTTWMASALSAHPDVHLVYEPDNRGLDLLGWLGTARTGSVPSLEPGERPRDYELMWRVAFAGGWPERGAVAAPVDLLRRIAVAGSA